ncbi:hypothetical protein NUH88_15100 [Nisaea acidiphila]|uniref:Uncharacterized protein n=1 Tax=Nisaea acidiphila TaxID=1862145 RepID=A0A9J7AQ52_9PROT|nr:hypothetical protein [Nisaea acidiphila]UUX48729.1 hypothetical protein NUH88_15100 [Nisaea acidiphila]
MLNKIDTARSYYRETMSLLVRSGYRISIENDMGEWKHIMQTAPATTAVSSMFDPAKAEFLPGDAFWLRVSNKNAQTVAIICDRLIETEDFVGFVEGTGMFAAPYERHELGTRLTGKIGHAGGLWVHPKARKTGLSWVLPRLVRALSVMHWGVDRHCGIILTGLANAGFANRIYGFSRSWLALSGAFRPTGQADGLFVIDINADEIAGQQAFELESIMDNRAQNLVDVATIGRERHHQPAVREPLAAGAGVNFG